MKILEYQYLVNLYEFMMLWKRISIGFVIKIFLIKVVYQSVIIKDLQKLIWTQFNSLLKRLLQLILMPLSILLDFHLSAPSSKALKKALLGDNTKRRPKRYTFPC
jgi:hypothetical protein